MEAVCLFEDQTLKMSPSSVDSESAEKYYKKETLRDKIPLFEDSPPDRHHPYLKIHHQIDTDRIVSEDLPECVVDVPKKSTHSTKTCASLMKDSSVPPEPHTYIQEDGKQSHPECRKRSFKSVEATTSRAELLQPVKWQSLNWPKSEEAVPPPYATTSYTHRKLPPYDTPSKLKDVERPAAKLKVERNFQELPIETTTLLRQKKSKPSKSRVY